MQHSRRTGMLSMLREALRLPMSPLPIRRSRSITARGSLPPASLVRRIAGTWIQRRPALHLDQRR